MEHMIAAPRRILVAGASGTIGSAVTARLVADGHAVTAPGRAALADAAALAAVMAEAQPEVVISCIPSRSGAPKDAEAIDYQANLAQARHSSSCFRQSACRGRCSPSSTPNSRSRRS
jgi:divinyl chlorophyllide a 8-vinyl-reductase